MGKLIINQDEFITDDTVLTGRDVCLLAGKVPPSDYTVVIAGSGTTHSLGQEEQIETEKFDGKQVILEKSDCIFRATLNEREFVWPRETITGANIRQFADLDENQELILDSKRDMVVDDDDIIKLSRKGVERFRTRQNPEVIFYINGTEVTGRKGKYKFKDIVRLAFPAAEFGGDKCYTVGWDKGPRNAESGELLEGERLRIIEGVIIDVSATDKS